MRTNTLDRYADRIDRVIGRLNDSVEASPRLDDLADLAGISRFHFLRMYHALTGETPGATLRRLRLARGVSLLADSSRPVTEIAFDAGYASSQAFAKALRRHCGHSASALRHDERLRDMALAALSRPTGPSVRADLAIRLVSVPPFEVIAERHVGPEAGLFGAYGALMAWLRRSGQAGQLQGIYGVPLDDVRCVPAASVRFDVAFDVGAGPRGDERRRALLLGGGRYAIVRHTGPFEGLGEKYDQLYAHWLPTSGAELRDAPLFNHYLTDPEAHPPEDWQTDVYLPIAEEEAA